MIAEREIVDIKPVEERPTTTVSLTQPKWSDKLFIASNICFLAGLLIIAIAVMLPVGTLNTVLITFPMSITASLALLITEASLFAVGTILFVLGFVWPRIK